MQARWRARPRAFVGALVVAVVGLGLVPAGPAGASAGTGPALVTDPAGLVDTFVGTSPARSGDAVNRGNDSPAAAYPHGDVVVAPVTPVAGEPPGRNLVPGTGYAAGATTTDGLAATEVEGSGCRSGGDLESLPTTQDPASSGDLTALTEPIYSQNAHPGYFQATIGGVAVKAAAALHSAIIRYDFPATADARVLVKLDGSETGDSDTHAALSQGDSVLAGSFVTGHFCERTNPTYTVYFAQRFSRPPLAATWWSGGTQSATPPPSASGVDLDFGPGPPVVETEAISYVSVDGGAGEPTGTGAGPGALGNLDREQTDTTVASVASAATAAWNALLGRIEIGGGTLDQEKVFYSNLYQTGLDPVVESDDDGEYRGFDGSVDQVAGGYQELSDISGWDVEKTAVPLLALDDPQIAEDLAYTCLNEYAQTGSLTSWVLASTDPYPTTIMPGTPFSEIIPELWSYGIRGWASLPDATADALAAMVVDAGASLQPAGFVPSTTGREIGLAIETSNDDYAASQFADALGETASAAQLGADAASIYKLMDHEPGNPTVLLTPRDTAGFETTVTVAPASGPPAPMPWGPTTVDRDEQYTVEASPIQETVASAPWSVTRLAADFGGRTAFERFLTDDFFAVPDGGAIDPGGINAGRRAAQDWQGNEVTFLTPWIYAALSDPGATQTLVRTIEDDLFAASDGPETWGVPGNDDTGAESAWLVLAELGAMPLAPGAGTMVVDSPLFPEEVIHDAAGATVTILAPGASDGLARTASITGTPGTVDNTLLLPALWTRGGTVVFHLASTAG